MGWGRLLRVAVWLIAVGCSRVQTDRSNATIQVEPPWFDDVTQRVGLVFTHSCGGEEQGYFVPRVIGSGGAVLDANGDGRLDVYLIHNGGPRGPVNRLFLQQSDGTFRDATTGSGLDVAGFGQGVAIGDVNNDGRPDVLLTEYGAIRLFLNEGGKFREVTQTAGISNAFWGTSAAFVDYDRDDWLDLVVANYLNYDASLPCKYGGEHDFCGPRLFPGLPTRLFRNLGASKGVTFEDATAKSGLGAVLAKGLGVFCADVDGDHWPDILVANDMMANHLWINRRDGTFREEGTLRRVAYTGNGETAANMGIAWGDVDGDGLPDLFVTHLNSELHTLWGQRPRGFFEDRTIGAGLNRGLRGTGFGATLTDFDRDGWLDLAWVNGNVYRNQGVTGGSFWSKYAQRHQIFANGGNGRFRDISGANQAFCGTAGVGRGLIVADIDNDGAPDLIVTEIASPVRVLRNISPSRGHWLSVRAVLPMSGGRDAYGAEIAIDIGTTTVTRLLNPAGSYCVSNDPRCHFGLGDRDRFDRIRVIWPDGSQESFAGGLADRLVTLRRGNGQPMP